MSRTVDERVVSMQFDNRHFEKNVQTSMSTLEKLKQSLNFKGASKGLENISSSASKVNFSSLANGLETVRAKFSALEVVGVTALANITNSAVNAGKKIVSALTIDPVMSGFQEYETQINAVQTILANTQSKGSTLKDVNAALDELNTYADKTIYNFTEMTRNIGTFTAAGVDLDKSVSSIKGIANLAAVSGSSSLQASTAMYQLSQAIAAGKVQLMDWNSVVNAGMGGELFQNALKRTAEHFGTNVDAMIEKYGSFRESLTQGGWLTTDVLTETLTQISGAYSEADLIAQGYSEKQAKEIAQLAETAVDAATKVKTFTQLFDTLKEALQSGWTQSWEIIIGDFEDAKELFTGISDALGKMISESADARNKVLSGGLSSGWDQFLNQGISDEAAYVDILKSVAKEHDVAIDKMIDKSGSFEKTLKEGWLTSDMLSESVSKYADKLRGMSDAELKAAGYTREHLNELEALETGIKNGTISLDEFIDKMSKPSGRENLIEAAKNAFEGLMGIVAPVKEAFSEIFPPITAQKLYDFTVGIRDLTEKFKISGETAEKLKSIFKGVFSIFDMGGQALSAVFKPLIGFLGGDTASSIRSNLLMMAASIGDFFTELNEGIKAGDGFSAVSDAVSKVLNGIGETISKFMSGFGGIGDVLGGIGETISKVFGKIKDVVGWIRENISAGDIFAGLAGGGIFVAAKKFSGFIDKIKDAFTGFFGEDKDSGVKSQFGKVLDGLHDSLESFSSGIKVTSLVAIAGAVMMLTSSVRKLSEIKPEKIAVSLAAIRLMIASLNSGFKSLTKTLSSSGGKGTVKAAISMIAMAEAINIIASAMEKIGKLSMTEIAKGLTGIGGALAALSLSVKLIGKGGVTQRTSIAILALAKACEMLSGSLKTFGSMSWEEIDKGLAGMGGALGELTATLGILSKVGGGGAFLGSTGLLVAVQSLDEISENLERIGKLSWDEIDKGLSGMGGALGELTVCLGILSKAGGFGTVLGGGGLLIASQSLDEISENLKRIGELSWEEIGKGLTGMGGALLELGTVSGALGKLTGFSGISGSITVVMGVQALEPLAEALSKFGSMSWDTIAHGLAGMGGALLELGVVSGALGKLTGLSGMLGSGALLVGIEGLGDLADALKKFGEMSWEEIGRGLVAMGSALLEVGVISGTLGSLTNVLGVLGSASLLLGIEGLGKLADALKKFGEMNWDEIGRGLAAMGGAMLETAIGGLLNTLSGLGAESISTIAEPLGILADSVKKWADVKVPDGLGDQLGSLAWGIMKFNFSGWGGEAIQAVASPLGILADSVKKWTDVKVPEGLGDQLAALAPGIKAFNFAGWGADAVESVAGSLGTMADSVKKWASVSVPKDLEENLTGIANGINKFGFLSGWKTENVVKPLSGLADSVKKWENVTVPENLEDGLKSIANGIDSFGIFSDWKIDDVSKPLSDLGIALKNWNGVYISPSVGDYLPALAEGLKSFKKVKFDSLSNESVGTAIANIKSLISTINSMGSLNAGNIETFSGAVESLGKISLDGLTTTLSSASSQVQTAITTLLNSITASLSAGSIGVGIAANTIGKSIGTNIATGLQLGVIDITIIITSTVASIASSLSSQSEAFRISGISMGLSLADGIASSISAIPSKINGTISRVANSIKNQSSAFSSVGLSLITALNSGFINGGNKLSSTAQKLISDITNTIKLKNGEFFKIGSSLISYLARGLSSAKNEVRVALSTVLSSAVTQIRDYHGRFYSAGSYLAQGFADGIADSAYAARINARAMANAAARAAEDALDEHSPSRVFYGIGDYAGKGFINALGDYEDKSYKASYGMATYAKKGLTKAISKINDYVSGNMDLNPTVRPVLDLSEIESRAGAIGSLLNRDISVGTVGTARVVGSMMNKRQNGNYEVISAINKLRKDLGNIPRGNSYNINGITYDDGSNIANAIESLVRATRIERRS